MWCLGQYRTCLMTLPGLCSDPLTVTNDPGASALLDGGRGHISPDARDTPLHQAHCTQAKNKDARVRRSNHEAYQSAPYAFTGYFLDPEILRLVAGSSFLPPPVPLSHPSTCQPGGSPRA